MSYRPFASAVAALLVTGIGHAETDSSAESFYRGNEFFYRYLEAVTAQ